MPSKQRNEISALTFLALCNIEENDDWSDAQRVSLGVSKGIMKFIADKYSVKYKPNTRETVRRQVLHQFVEGAIALYNPDNPNLPVNSPNVHYAISPDALKVVKTFGTDLWEDTSKIFRQNVANLAKKYKKARESHRVPIVLPDGKELILSPGDHNELQKAIIETFLPTFAKGSKVLYVGDTELKDLFNDQDKLKQLGVTMADHSKLPDVIIYDEKKDWIYLIEAVTSHGPIGPKRLSELNHILKSCDSGKIFVTAFLTISDFSKFSNDIAWETEIWIKENPGHMIHFNGDKFIGPR